MTGVDPPLVVLQLRDAIRASGLSLTRLGAAAGVDPGQLSRFMRGERGLTLDSAGLICRTLGITFAVPEILRSSADNGSPGVPPPRPATGRSGESGYIPVLAVTSVPPPPRR